MISPDRGEDTGDEIEASRKRALVTPELQMPTFHDDATSFPTREMARLRYLFDLLEVPQELLDRLPLPTSINTFEGPGPEFATLDDAMAYLDVTPQILDVVSLIVREMAPRDALALLLVNDPVLHENLSSSLTLFLSRKVSRTIIEYSQGKGQREHFVLDTAITSLSAMTEEAIDSMEAQMQLVNPIQEIELT